MMANATVWYQRPKRQPAGASANAANATSARTHAPPVRAPLSGRAGRTVNVWSAVITITSRSSPLLANRRASASLLIHLAIGAMSSIEVFYSIDGCGDRGRLHPDNA